jgi:hypothetical protein
MKPNFTLKVAQDIADKSFGYTLDCLLGYSDSRYGLEEAGDDFEQNFIEDLEERGFVVTDNRIAIIKQEYDKMKDKFILYIRKKYYK